MRFRNHFYVNIDQNTYCRPRDYETRQYNVVEAYEVQPFEQVELSLSFSASLVYKGPVFWLQIEGKIFLMVLDQAGTLCL